METMIFIATVIIVYHFACVAALGSNKNWLRDVALDGHIGYSGYLPDIQTRSATECGKICTKESACMSFFFVPTTNVCQLHDFPLETTAGLDTLAGSKFYVRQIPYFYCPTDDNEYREVLLPDNTVWTYKIFKTTLVIQATAVTNCYAEGPGHHLVRITSEAKMATLLALTQCPGYGTDYWTDLTNTLDVNNWVSSIGEPLPPTGVYWDPSQPNSPTIDHCAVIWQALGYDLCDRHCSNFSYAYICEVDN